MLLQFWEEVQNGLRKIKRRSKLGRPWVSTQGLIVGMV